MNNFPRKNTEASVYLLKDGQLYSAYLKLKNVIFNVSIYEDLDRVGYIPGEAKRVGFGELPEAARGEFTLILSDFGLSEKSYGLEKLPEFIEVSQINGFTVLRKRKKMRVNNFRVMHKGKEVWKGNSIEGANAFIENSV